MDNKVLLVLAVLMIAALVILILYIGFNAPQKSVDARAIYLNDTNRQSSIQNIEVIYGYMGVGYFGLFLMGSSARMQIGVPSQRVNLSDFQEYDEAANNGNLLRCYPSAGLPSCTELAAAAAPLGIYQTLYMDTGLVLDWAQLNSLLNSSDQNSSRLAYLGEKNVSGAACDLFTISDVRQQMEVNGGAETFGNANYTICLDRESGLPLSENVSRAPQSYAPGFMIAQSISHNASAGTFYIPSDSGG